MSPPNNKQSMMGRLWADIWIVLSRLMSDRPPSFWRKQTQKSIFINLPLLHHGPCSLCPSFHLCLLIHQWQKKRGQRFKIKCEERKRVATEEDPCFCLCFRESRLFIALTNMTSLLWFLFVSKPFFNQNLLLQGQKKNQCTIKSSRC